MVVAKLLQCYSKHVRSRQVWFRVWGLEEIVVVVMVPWIMLMILLLIGPRSITTERKRPRSSCVVTRGSSNKDSRPIFWTC